MEKKDAKMCKSDVKINKTVDKRLLKAEWQLKAKRSYLIYINKSSKKVGKG